MASTPNYNFTLPTIGGDQNTWGNELNANWSSLDTLLHNATSSTGSFLPLTGGSLSGSLSVAGAIQGNATLGVTGLIAINFPTVNDFEIYRSAPNRVLSWASGTNDVYNETNGTRYINTRSGSYSFDPSGNLTVSNGGFKPGGGPWGSSSDERVKRNVEPYLAGLHEVCRLQPVSFEYNGAGGTRDDGVRYRGFLAQAARGIMPELVFEMPPGDDHLPGQLGTDLGPLTLAMCNAIRELADRVGALEDAA